jgi:hypothetical protein
MHLSRGRRRHASPVGRVRGLFAGMPELDSMAVVALAVNLEREFDFEIDDEDFTGKVFETIGTLAAFVEQSKPGSGNGTS